MSENDQKIEVRDFREKAFFLVDDAYLNGYARLCGLSATGVYLSLCRHANRDQKAWPSILRMAKELAVSTRTIVRAIKTLENHHIISVGRGQRKDGHQDVNVYVLLDKSMWITGQGDTRELRKQRDKSSVTNNSVTPGTWKDTQPLEGNTEKKETHLQTAPDGASAEEVVSIIEIFSQSNPSLSYGNTTERKAAAWLIGKYGLEKAAALSRAAIGVLGEPYAPIITTPHALRRDVAKLAAFIQRRQKSPPKGTIQSL